MNEVIAGLWRTAVLDDPARRLCGSGATAGESWALWRHFLSRGPTQRTNSEFVLRLALNVVTCFGSF